MIEDNIINVLIKIAILLLHTKSKNRHYYNEPYSQPIMSYSRQAIYNATGVIVSAFCQWLIIMIIPKITDYSDAGIFAATISICSMLNIVATFSLNQFQISDQYNKYEENEYLVARLITIMVSYVSIIPIVLFMSYDVEQTVSVFIYMTYRNLIHLSYHYTATLQFYNKLDYVGIITVVEGIVSFSTFTLFFSITNDLLLSVLMMTVLGGGIFLVLTLIGYKKYTKRRITISFRTKYTKKLLLIGVPLLFASITPLIITALPKLILQYYWGNNILGIFSTISSPTIAIPLMVTSAFLPFITYFSNITRENNFTLLKKQYTKVLAALAGLGLIAMIISFLFAKISFNLIYNDDLDDYIDYFHILVLGVIFYSIGLCGTSVLITKNQGPLSAYTTAIVLIVSIIIFVIMIPADGLYGATYGLLYAYFIYAVAISLCVYIAPLKNDNEKCVE